jgi:hypothetical protein
VRHVGIGHLGDASHRDLRRDAKLISRHVIGCLVQVKLLDGSSGKANFGHPVTRFVATLQRRQEQLGLLLRRLQLDVDNQFHSSIMDKSVLRVKPEFAAIAATGRPAIPPRHECRGISRRNR